MLSINLNKNFINPFSLLDSYFSSFSDKIKKTKLHFDSLVLISSFKLIESKLLSELKELESIKDNICLEDMDSIDFDGVYSYYMDIEDIFTTYLDIASKRKKDKNMEQFIAYIESILDTLHKISWIYQSFETKLIKNRYAS